MKVARYGIYFVVVQGHDIIAYFYNFENQLSMLNK